MKALVNHEGLHCANCGTPMQGNFCHACGQSIHSVLKPVHHMLEDTMDLVLHVDARVVHTLPPLLLRPGFLTLEYFAGRRVRYIAPFRLMFVLCLLAFFVSHFVIDRVTPPYLVSEHGPVETGTFDDGEIHVASFRQANTPTEVKQALQHELDRLQPSPAAPAMATAALQLARRNLRHQANLRLQALDAKPRPAAESVTSSEQASPLSQHWDARQHPIAIRWLPDFANRRLQQMALRLHANLDALSSDNGTSRQQAIERIKAGIFGVLPQAMFVLMPIFALLLKLLYLFRRRLYMEHLIVALHSHAFLFFSLLLGMLLHLLIGWLTPHAAWLATPLGWLESALWIWAPIYLLLMQKRIYRQGWPLTVAKYLTVGWCYCWLLATVVAFAAILGLAH